jgi:hypothetical protein
MRFPRLEFKVVFTINGDEAMTFHIETSNDGFASSRMCKRDGAIDPSYSVFNFEKTYRERVSPALATIAPVINAMFGNIVSIAATHEAEVVNGASKLWEQDAEGRP